MEELELGGARCPTLYVFVCVFVTFILAPLYDHVHLSVDRMIPLRRSGGVIFIICLGVCSPVLPFMSASLWEFVHRRSSLKGPDVRRFFHSCVCLPPVHSGTCLRL